jgi:hypothetical protein
MELLILLLGAGSLVVVLSLFGPTRVLAIYLGCMAASAVVIGFLIGALGFAAAGALSPYSGVGQQMVMGIGGLISFGIGAFFGIPAGAVIAHRLTRRRPPL